MIPFYIATSSIELIRASIQKTRIKAFFYIGSKKKFCFLLTHQDNSSAVTIDLRAKSKQKMLPIQSQIFIQLFLFVTCNYFIFGIEAQRTGGPKRKPISELNVEEYTTRLINKLLPRGYNKNLRPNYGGDPLVVNISLQIVDISAISEASMEFRIDFYIRHFWNDHRLRFEVLHGIDQVTLAEDFTKQIWQPDTYFANGRQLDPHKTISSYDTTLFRIKSSGDIIYSTRVILLAQCPMNLTFFPLDRQKCAIEIASYGLVDSEMTYRFQRDPSAVEIKLPINLPSFRLIGFNKLETAKAFSTGNYSRLFCEIFLERLIGYYVSQIYVPSFLIVVISWIPFWLDQNDHHARVALGVTTVLTMTTLVTSTNTDLTKISHLTAIDFYLFACFIMVFFSLIEYATVGYYEVKTWELYRRQLKQNSNVDAERESRANDAERVSEKTREKDINYDDIGNSDKNSMEQTPPFPISMSMSMSRMWSGPPGSNMPFPVPITTRPVISKSEPAVTRRRRLKWIKRLAAFRDTSIIDYWARRIFPAAFVVFNIVYVLLVTILVHIDNKRQQIEDNAILQQQQQRQKQFVA